VILQFSVSNFRAFRGRQILNFVASNYDKSLPSNCIAPHLPGLSNRRFVRAIAIYGANASGKSTVVEAVSTLARLVRDSASTTDPKAPMALIQPFALAPGQSEIPTAFSITFATVGKRFEYRLAATQERVWHESLRAFLRGKQKLWFSRDWLKEEQRYQWNPNGSAKATDEDELGFQRDTRHEAFTLPNALYLSTAVKLNDQRLEPVYRWFKDELHIFQQGERPVGFSFSTRQLIEQSQLANEMVNLLKHADLGITGVAAEEVPFSATPELLNSLDLQTRERVKDAKVPKVQFFHRTEHEPVLLSWEVQSAGTRRLFSLSGPWLDILAKGYTVFVDELDTSIHHLMAVALLSLYFGKRNEKGSQVVFTTHNPLLLDPTLLRRDQIWFTDKDDRGQAHLYPLTDYRPRKGESVTRGYLSGRYGAIPFVPDGLFEEPPLIDPEQLRQDRQ
jgi:uncharacterized protein